MAWASVRHAQLHAQLLQALDVRRGRVQLGCRSDAQAAFWDAEVAQRLEQPQFRYLYCLAGFQYCDLLLDQGRYQEVLARTRQTLEWANETGLPLYIALDHLTLGRALLREAVRVGTTDLAHAADSLGRAVDGLRRAGRQDMLALGLLARAELHRTRGNAAQSRADLGEALGIATADPRGHLRLTEVDVHLLLAECDLHDGRRTDARQALDLARQLVRETGYHRRDQRLRELESQC
jgi:tetratricopeptide (TPR) repeat protein